MNEEHTLPEWALPREEENSLPEWAVPRPNPSQEGDKPEGAPAPKQGPEDSVAEAKEPHPLLTFLREDLVDPETKKSFGLEGFKTKTYNPGGESGITIGTGIDLKHHTKQSMIDKGVSEEVAEKLSSYYGKSDKSLAGKSPLTKAEVELVDEAVLADTIKDLEKDIPHFKDMPQEMQKAALMAKHQYGKKWPTLRGHLQAKNYRLAIAELLKWADKSKDGLGSNIGLKYQALGKIAQQAYFTDFYDSVYENPDNKDGSKVEGGVSNE